MSSKWKLPGRDDFEVERQRDSAAVIGGLGDRIAKLEEALDVALDLLYEYAYSPGIPKEEHLNRVTRFLSGFENNGRRGYPSCDDIATAAMDIAGITPAEFYSRATRGRTTFEHALIVKVVASLARESDGYVGRRLDRDRSTVCKYRNEFPEDMRYNEEMRVFYQRVKDRLSI